MVRLLRNWLTEPGYFSAEIIPNSRTPAVLGYWLDLQTPLTSAIAEYFGSFPEVVVRYSGGCELTSWEADLLGIVDNQGFARQIELRIGRSPVVVARTVVEQSGVAQQLVAQLEETPLAKLLFEDARWQHCSDLLPLETDGGIIGRARAWRYAPTREKIVVEEFFLAPLL